MPNKDKYYGNLKVSDHEYMLTVVRTLIREKSELDKLLRNDRSKLERLKQENGMYWWEFYSNHYISPAAFLIILLNQSDALTQAAQEEDPSEAFLNYIRPELEYESVDEEIDSFTAEEKSLLINLLYCLYYNIESIGYYGYTIDELIEADSSSKNHQHFLHAVSVDRCVLFTDYGKDLLASAQLTNNKKLLSGIFKRIKSPHGKRAQKFEARIEQRILEDVKAIPGESWENLADLLHVEMGLDVPVDSKRLNELFRRWRPIPRKNTI